MNFKETKEAIQFANEHLMSGGFFNTLRLTASPIHDNAFSAHAHEPVDILNHLYDWSLSSINHTSGQLNDSFHTPFHDTLDPLDSSHDIIDSDANQHIDHRSRLFYLFGDFGSGKSGVCKALVNQLYHTYEESLYGDTTAKPTLPIYLDLRVLTGSYDDFTFANKRLAELIEVMFYATGVSKINDLEGNKGIDGDDIIKLVRQYPCVVVFDGFDEAVQKLNKNQQNGFLNKLLSILPNVQYTKDLMRIMGQPVEESTIPDSPSRIVISCRTQLFESKQEQTAFIEAFYGTEMSINGLHNYQAYQLDHLTSDTVRSTFQRTIHTSNQGLPAYQQLNLTHEDSRLFIDYLVDLSINPLLMSLSQSLLPSIQPALEQTGFINSAELFAELIGKLIQRDNGKGIINVAEKQKLFGGLALKIWQARTGFISLENLRQFFYTHYADYRQIQLAIDTGRVDIEVAMQDLHSSMIVRDALDRYRFYHPLIFDYFLAVGIFEVFSTPKDTQDLSAVVDYVFQSPAPAQLDTQEAQTRIDTIDALTIDTLVDTLIDTLSEDSLIFISQMVASLVYRGDMPRYNHCYQQWLRLCEQVAGLNDSDTLNSEVQSQSHTLMINKALEMWDIVINDVVPSESVLHTFC